LVAGRARLAVKWFRRFRAGHSAFSKEQPPSNGLEQPATGLDRRRPIDLMTTPAGLELVEDYLGRIEYGVCT
jgi:putative toxin-antitoxin system antitoxin component (TIGR02293 family)